jgi:hypothetical protein
VKLLNPNRAVSASYDQSINMKKLILLCICSIALAAGLFAQAPTVSPIASPPAATVTPTTTASVSQSDLADRIHQKLEKKLRGHHGITIDTGDKDEDADLRKMRDFVAIVIMIGMFTLLVSRMRQRTIRMMVEKGQPIPAELLAPAARSVRRRSDVRRGVIWAMVGLGTMIFFGAVNDWEGGAWSLGLIPFLIGLGYLLVWKLEGKNNVPPPPPAP